MNSNIKNGYCIKNVKDACVCLFQYFLKYEGQLAEKIRSINQHGLEAVGAIETEISLSEVRIKTAEEKLLRLREKVAQLLLKIHPVSVSVAF